MLVRDMSEALELRTLAGGAALEREIAGGYSADLLSCVMARAKSGGVWVTLQAHPNVVAVAALLDLAAVIITEDSPVPPEVIAKADSERIPLLASSHTTFWIVSQLARLGIQAQE